MQSSIFALLKIISPALILLIVCTYIVTAAPVISNVSTPAISDTTAAVEWQTDIPARCFVDFGLTASYGSQTFLDAVHFYRRQMQGLTGLTASTPYHYRLTCIDGNGNTTVDNDRTLTTTASPSTVWRMPTPTNPNQPDMTGATVKTVCNVDPCPSGAPRDYTLAQFQTALNDAYAATGKRRIIIEAGQEVVGNFKTGVKADGACVQIQSANVAMLTAGNRVTPADVGNLARITTSNTGAPVATFDINTGVPAAATCTIFTGIEITIKASALADAPGGASQSGLVRIGTGSETSQAQLPHNFRFDRCWIHGLGLKNTRRGIDLSGEDIVIVDSTLEEFHDTGADSQAILIRHAKRWLVLNSYVQGAGENTLSGGVDQTIANYATSDGQFYYCVFPWLLSWKSNDPSWDGKDWITKNNSELKKGERIVYYGNIFGPWWESEQTGGTLSFKNSNDDPDPIVRILDVFVFRNKFTKVGAGIVINGSLNPLEESTDYMHRVGIWQNLFEIDGITYNNEDTGSPSSGNVSIILESVVSGGIKHYPDDLSIRHNTFVNGRGGDRRIHLFNDPQVGSRKGQRFTFQDNVLTYNIFGIKANGTAEGTASLDAAMNNSNYTWSTNLVAGISTNYPPPSSQYVNTPTDIQFVNYNNGIAGGNFRLSATSPGHNAASDGTDIGANIDAMELATATTLSGNASAGGSSGGGAVISGKITVSGKVVIR